jgi:hypothetical protein
MEALIIILIIFLILIFVRSVDRNVKPHKQPIYQQIIYKVNTECDTPQPLNFDLDTQPTTTRPKPRVPASLTASRRLIEYDQQKMFG